MNYRFFILLITLGVSSTITRAQGPKFGFGLGYATFDLQSIKDAQNNALRFANLDNIKATESFPNRAFGSFFFGYEFRNKSSLGFTYSYYSTGGRNAVADYSGEYKLDLELEANQYGLCYDIKKSLSDKFALGGSFSAGILLNEYDITEVFIINGSPRINYEVNLEGFNIYLEPAVVATYTIVNDLNCFLKVGYEKNITKELYLSTDKEQKSTLDADWTGVRISTGIYYTFRSE